MNEPSISVSPSCADDFDPNSLSVEVALERIQSEIQPISGFETVPVRSALGRIVARDVRSKVDVPNHTNSAMDGYAISAADIPAQGIRELTVVGTALAGRPYQGNVGTGQCVRIMTGAPMPNGTDTVVMQERAERIDDVIRINHAQKSGQNVREAGEDIAYADIVLQAGRRLLPADIGLLASVGIGEVVVTRQLRVAFFSTGDELRSIGEPLDAGTVYDSNRYTLYGMLTRLGVEVIDMGVIRDTREETLSAFAEAATCADAIITSGGVSVGEADFVKEALDHVGEINFWKVAMKPGRPLAFGRIKDAYFFGLPGNPVSVMATFYIFVQPALRKLMNEHQTEPLLLKVRCESKLRKRPGRVEYQRGIMEHNDQGQYVVRKTGAQGSGILSSMSQANCFIVLPTENDGVRPGEQVQVLPFASIV